MIENTSFENLFLNACDFIGYTEEELTEKLGEPNQIDTGSNGNRYLVYDDAEVMFEISHSRGILISARAPFRADPKGIREGYYNLLGAKVGDTKERVYQMWGNPSNVQGVELIYNTKLGTTSSGHNFETRIAIIDGELKDFSGVLFIQTPQKPKSGCFIATACYGNYEATEVLVLRNYRDKVLLKNNFGKIAVDIYYFISPPIAKILEKSDSLKTFVRKNILAPIILKIKHNQK
jgi:hypothetical protein